MNSQQFKECWDQCKGLLQKHWLNFSDEDLREVGGSQEKFQTLALARYGDRKDEVVKWADRWYAKWTGWYERYEETKPAS